MSYGCPELVYTMQYVVLKFNHAKYGLTEVLDLGVVASVAAAG
jgi:hypothetical protein